MHRYRSSLIVALVALAFALDFGSILHAQVGKGSIVDVNTAAEKDLLALPQMTPAIVKGIIEKRPFASIVELNAYLTSQSLTPAQLNELYRQSVHPRESEHRDQRGNPADPWRGEPHGPGVRRVPSVEDVGAVRQGDRQVRRPGRNRPSEAVRVHPCEPEYCER